MGRACLRSGPCTVAPNVPFLDTLQQKWRAPPVPAAAGVRGAGRQRPAATRFVAATAAAGGPRRPLPALQCNFFVNRRALHAVAGPAQRLIWASVCDIGHSIELCRNVGTLACSAGDCHTLSGQAPALPCLLPAAALRCGSAAWPVLMPPPPPLLRGMLLPPSQRL